MVCFQLAVLTWQHQGYIHRFDKCSFHTQSQVPHNPPSNKFYNQTINHTPMSGDLGSFKICYLPDSLDVVVTYKPNRYLQHVLRASHQVEPWKTWSSGVQQVVDTPREETWNQTLLRSSAYMFLNIRLVEVRFLTYWSALAAPNAIFIRTFQVSFLFNLRFKWSASWSDPLGQYSYTSSLWPYSLE